MKLVRFNKTERLFHWAFAIPMTLLALSGISMIAASLGGHPAMKEAIRHYHVRFGFALMLLPPLVYAIGDRGTIHDNIREFFHLSAEDRRWLKLNLVGLVRPGVRLPPGGKFNGGQKINAIMMMGLSGLLCASGLTMVALHGALAANIVHLAAFAAFLLLFCGHLYLATINPSTRPALAGIIKGQVPADWLRHHHERMYEEKKGAIFDGMVLEHATAADLRTVYARVYANTLSRREFRRLRRNSVAMLMVRREETPAAFMQVVGDGVTCGAVARYHAFIPEADSDEFREKSLAAAAHVLGYPLGCRPVLP